MTFQPSALKPHVQIANERTEVVAEPFISGRHVSAMSLKLSQRDSRVKLEICATLRFLNL